MDFIKLSHDIALFAIYMTLDANTVNKFKIVELIDTWPGNQSIYLLTHIHV